MSKEEFLKIQTCALRVNIHCDGCKQKVKKLLQKIDGVYTTTIDAEQGKVTVSGNVDSATLIKKLAKSGKHAELWSTPKGGGNNNNQLNNQFQKMQIDNSKGQKDGKAQKGGKDQKGAQQQLQQPQQMKGMKDFKLPQLKDLKLPFKDQKSVKFNLPEDEEFSDDYDEFDDEDDEFDDDYDDEFEDEHEELMKAQAFKDFKMKPLNGPAPGQGHPLMNGPQAMTDKKGVGGAGNGNKNVQVPIKGGNNDGKNNNGGKKGGGNNGGANPNQNQTQNQNQGGGGKNGGKNGGGNNKNAPPNNNGGGNNNPQGAKKGCGGGQKDMGQSLSEMMDQLKGGAGEIGGQVGHMGNGHMPAAGNASAVQGLPMNFQGAGPEMMAGNPYQQQYLASMMQQLQHQQQLQQHQQRLNGGFQPMMYARPPPAVAYAPPYMYPQYPPSAGPEYANFFSDENTNSCSVM